MPQEITEQVGVGAQEPVVLVPYTVVPRVQLAARGVQEVPEHIEEAVPQEITEQVGVGADVPK